MSASMEKSIADLEVELTQLTEPGSIFDNFIKGTEGQLQATFHKKRNAKVQAAQQEYVKDKSVKSVENKYKEALEAAILEIEKVVRETQKNAPQALKKQEKQASKSPEPAATETETQADRIVELEERLAESYEHCDAVPSSKEFYDSESFMVLLLAHQVQQEKYTQVEKSNASNIEEIGGGYEKALQDEIDAIESFLLQQKTLESSEEKTGKDFAEPEVGINEASPDKLKEEIKKLESTIKVRFSSYNATLEPSHQEGVKSMLEYSALSGKSGSQKKQIEQYTAQHPDQTVPIELYEAHKNALKEELDAMDAILKRQQSNPNINIQATIKTDNPFTTFSKVIANAVGRSRVGRFFNELGDTMSELADSVGRSRAGRFFNKLGDTISGLIESARRMKSVGSSLSTSNVESTASEVLAEKASDAIQEIHEALVTRASESQSHNTPHGNPTLFSDALSAPGEPPPVDKAALVEQQRLTLEQLTKQIDSLDEQFFHLEISSKLTDPEPEFKEIKDEYWQKRREYKKLIEDYTAGKGEKDLQKIYDAGLRYERALGEAMTKEFEYLKAEKPGYQPH